MSNSLYEVTNLDDLLDVIEAAGGEVSTSVRNGLSINFKELQMICTFVRKDKGRALIVEGVWDFDKPKEPSVIHIEYLEGVIAENDVKCKAAIQKFEEKLATHEYAKRNFDFGLYRFQGESEIDAPNGLGMAIYASMGRNAKYIVDFLLGKKDYNKTDITYGNTWGNW